MAIRTSESKPVILYVEANIKNAFSLSAERLEWSLSGNRDSKACHVTNLHKTPYKLISATSSSDQFAVELIPTREGFEYEVSVTPSVSITNPVSTTITIQSECPPELSESRVYQFKVIIS